MTDNNFHITRQSVIDDQPVLPDCNIESQATEKNFRFVMLTVVLLAIMLMPTSEANGAVLYVQKVGEFSAGYSMFGVGDFVVPVLNGVSAGNSIIVTFVWRAPSFTLSSGPDKCEDTQANSYAIDITLYDSSTGMHTTICSAHNVTPLSTSDTITLSSSVIVASGAAATAHEFSGLASSSPLDQTASASGSSTTPSSGNTAVTTQADELLIGAIGVGGPPTDGFTPGGGYTALTSAGFSGGFEGTIRPEYKIISVAGNYQADGVLNPSRSWGAAIATYKAAASTTNITLSGTLYSDEGITPLAGQTVRLLVDGASAGTATTDASGNYAITAAVAAGDQYIPLLVYVDDGPVVGTTVMVLDSTFLTAIGDLDIYADHLVVRREGGYTAISNGDISYADGNYADTDILYYVPGSDLTVRGTNTELYIPNGHSYTPGGNVTTAHIRIEGTLTGGNNTFTVSGDWTNSDVFVPGTSTVILDGAGQTLNGTTTFYNLTKTVTSADTLIFSAGSTQTVTGSATLQGSSSQLLSLRSGTPGTRWNFNLASGATRAISHVDVQDSDASGSDAGLLEINPAFSTDSGNNVSWFGNANITVVKSSTVISDPVNGTVNPKRIPGAVVEYSILVSNTSGAQATNLTVTDDLGAESASLNFETNGYAAGKGVRVIAPNINGGVVLDLTNAADADQGDYGVTAADTVTVGGIVLDGGEQAEIRFRVTVR